MLKFNLRLLPWHLPSVGLSGPENTRCEIGDEPQRGKSSKAFSEPPSPSSLSLLLSATSTSLHFDCFVFFNIVVVVVVGPTSFYRRRFSASFVKFWFMLFFSTYDWKNNWSKAAANKSRWNKKAEKVSTAKKKLQLKQVSLRNKFLDFLFVRRLQFFPAQTDLWSRGSSLSATLMSSLTPDPGPTPPSACLVIVAAGATSYGTWLSSWSRGRQRTGCWWSSQTGSNEQLL